MVPTWKKGDSNPWSREQSTAISEQSRGGGRHSTVHEYIRKSSMHWCHCNDRVKKKKKKKKNSWNTACRAKWISLQSSLPNAFTSLCDTLASFDTSIQDCDSIYRPEKTEKHNGSPLTHCALAAQHVSLFVYISLYSNTWMK